MTSSLDQGNSPALTVPEAVAVEAASDHSNWASFMRLWFDGRLGLTDLSTIDEQSTAIGQQN